MTVILLYYTISYLQLIINSTLFSSSAFSWLFTSHRYSPLSDRSTWGIVNVAISFPEASTWLPLYHVTLTGVLKFPPLHLHESDSFELRIVELEQLIDIFRKKPWQKWKKVFHTKKQISIHVQTDHSLKPSMNTCKDKVK